MVCLVLTASIIVVLEEPVLYTYYTLRSEHPRKIEILYKFWKNYKRDRDFPTPALRQVENSRGGTLRQNITSQSWIHNNTILKLVKIKIH